MSTGMLLAYDTLDNHPQEIIDVLAAATADLFQGRMVTQIEEMWRQQRRFTDTTSEHYFQEILVYSSNLVHLFMRSKRNQDLVATLVCRRNVNVGMLFAQARSAMREFDAR